MLNLGAEKATIENFDAWSELVMDDFKDKNILDIFSNLELIKDKTKNIYVIKDSVYKELLKKARAANLIDLLTEEQWKKIRNPMKIIFSFARLETFVKQKESYQIENIVMEILSLVHLFEKKEFLTEVYVHKVSKINGFRAIKLGRDNYDCTLGEFNKALEELMITKKIKNYYSGNKEILAFANEIITKKQKKRIKNKITEKMLQYAKKDFSEAYGKMYCYENIIEVLTKESEMLNKIGTWLRNNETIARHIYFDQNNLYIPTYMFESLREINLREILITKEMEEELLEEMAIKFKGSEKRYIFEKDDIKYYTINGYEFYKSETGKQVKDETLVKELEAAHDYYV